MRRIGIVTDSSCDLPPELATRHGVTVVPLTVRFGEEALADGVDLDAAAFWHRLGTSERLPETAAPGPGAFLAAFDALADNEGVVCICLSSRLSGTYQAAVLAARQAEMPVKVVDSGVVSMALGLTVLTAAEAADAGGGLESVAATAAESARGANVFAALDTLEYLERGGRIGHLSALLGGVLDIKPLITLEDGVVAAAGRARTRKRALASIARHLAERAVSRVALIHSSTENLPLLRDALGLSGMDELVVAELGPVVGTHTGPGVLGVAYIEA
ncbi:MAG: DegV family protein [Acidimicrobiia bacterium]